MVMSSVGAVVLPCVLFYLFPLKFSRSAHRLATGKNCCIAVLATKHVRAIEPDVTVGSCLEELNGRL